MRQPSAVRTAVVAGRPPRAGVPRSGSTRRALISAPLRTASSATCTRKCWGQVLLSCKRVCCRYCITRISAVEGSPLAIALIALRAWGKLAPPPPKDLGTVRATRPWSCSSLKLLWGKAPLASYRCAVLASSALRRSSRVSKLATSTQRKEGWDVMSMYSVKNVVLDSDTHGLLAQQALHHLQHRLCLGTHQPVRADLDKRHRAVLGNHHHGWLRQFPRTGTGGFADAAALGQCRVARGFVKAVKNAQAPPEGVVRVAGDQQFEAMAGLDLDQALWHLRADRHQRHAPFTQAWVALALVIGQGDVARRAAGKTEENQHRRPVGQQQVEVQFAAFHIEQGERVQRIAHLHIRVGLRFIHQALALADIDLQRRRRPGGHTFGMQLS